uniref:Rossmann-like and DUF2520 domain-containing protein n=2 Tax=Roseivirga sp. TaxID=1964215 RepID=UPI0040480A37
MTSRIAIIGTGNVAWHLARTFENAGHIITEVYSRDIIKAKHFTTGFFNATATNSLDFRKSTAQIFILAISDDAIEEVASAMTLPQDAILAHTSGSVNMSTLGYAQTKNIGVFYPIQTFSKGKKVSFNELPIGIEGDNDFTESILRRLGSSISTKTLVMNSQARKNLHLAAVFACNFTNHMLTISKEIMGHKGLDFNLLAPLIEETLSKSLQIGPENAQTGPAKRGDFETLDKHYEALSKSEEIAEIYRIISQHIIDYYT